MECCIMTYLKVFFKLLGYATPKKNSSKKNGDSQVFNLISFSFYSVFRLVFLLGEPLSTQKIATYSLKNTALTCICGL